MTDWDEVIQSILGFSLIIRVCLVVIRAVPGGVICDDKFLILSLLKMLVILKRRRLCGGPHPDEPSDVTAPPLYNLLLN